MYKNEEKNKKKRRQNKMDVLEYLLDDPTKSVRNIAKEMGSYRQMVWRKKKELEDEHVIWGYTAVVNDSKLNRVSYIVLMKTKPMSEGLAELIIKRLVKEAPRKEGVRQINLCYVNGEYDWVMRFSAPSHAIARKYYDILRLMYDEYLLEKPVMIDVSFCLVAEGKINPEIKLLYDFVAEE